MDLTRHCIRRIPRNSGSICSLSIKLRSSNLSLDARAACGTYKVSSP